MIFPRQKLHLLNIENNDKDALLLEDYLKKGETDYVLQWEKELTEAKGKLAKNERFDAIFLGLSQSDTAGRILTQVADLAGPIPLIVLTDYPDKEFGINAMKSGATDFLIKDELSPFLLDKSLIYAIERKHIYNSLKRSEIEYRTLFDANPQPMWIYDVETLQFLHVNDSAVRQYGYSKEEFLRMTIKDIRPPLDNDRLIKTVHNIRTSNKFSRGLFRHLKKNGDLIFVDVKSNAIDFEGKKARLISSTDITEQVNAEEAYKFREQWFKALVQDGSDLISILDIEGNYKYVSPTTNSILGIRESELIGKNSFDFIHDEDKENVRRYFSLLSRQKRVDMPPFRFKDSNQQWRWIETTVTNMTDDPAVEGIVSNSRDVTERRNYLEAIKTQNKQLMEIAWAQSHIVRAPLARIMGLIDLLTNYPMQMGESADLLKHMLSSARELDDVLRDIVRKTEEVEAAQGMTPPGCPA